MTATSTPSVSLASLVSPPTSAQALTQLLAILTLEGFPATAWDSGSAGPVFAQTESQMVASLGATLAAVAAGGYLPLPGNPSSGAAGPWLDLLGTQVFQSPRSGATFTQGQVVLFDAANAGPFTIQPGALSCEEPSGTYLYTSTNATQLTLPLGGTLPVPVIAATGGAAYNLANGAITKLLSSLPGVTISNPPIGTTGTWITTVGTNAETDALYAQRLASKWATLGSGSNAGAYYYYATTPSVTGSSEVVQCEVFATAGTVYVVVAGAAAPISAAGLALVNAAIQAKRPLTVPVNVQNGIPSNTVFAGNVYVDNAHDPIATLSAVQVAISTYLLAVAIGGTLRVDAVIETIMNVPGVYDLSLTLPAANIAYGSTTIPTPNFLLTSSH